MKKWVVHPATGGMLEELLNDMDDQGYEPYLLDHNGNQMKENRLVPGERTMMPLYTCIFKARGNLIDA